MASAIECLPATLDLQDGLSSAGDGDILEVAALEVKLHARSRGKSPRPRAVLMARVFCMASMSVMRDQKSGVGADWRW